MMTFADKLATLLHHINSMVDDARHESRGCSRRAVLQKLNDARSVVADTIVLETKEMGESQEARLTCHLCCDSVVTLVPDPQQVAPAICTNCATERRHDSVNHQLENRPC